MKKISAHITCPQCQSGIEVYLNSENKKAQCGICHHELDLQVDKNHEKNCLETCVVCGDNRFYKQKDFNRKIGVGLFIIAAILSIWTYGISFIVFWLIDFFLFKRLGTIVICYKCETIYRNVANLESITDFDHQLHDRIVYSEEA